MGGKVEDVVSRQEKIMHILKVHDEVDATFLSEKVGASIATIRRDLMSLSEEGLLVRTHGGARALQAISTVASTFGERKRTMAPAKQAIALAAVRYVKPGMTIAVDNGTTTFFLVQALRGLEVKRVIASSLILVDSLHDMPDINVTCCGGEFRRRNLDFVGIETRECLQRWHSDIAFFTGDAYRPRRGLYKISHSSAEISRAMIYSTDLTILLMDHTKLNARGSALALSPDEIDLIITDDGITPDALAVLKTEHATIEVATIGGTEKSTRKDS